MAVESNRSILERHIVEGEAAIMRQKKMIAELERDGHPTRGSHILLDLFEESLRQARAALTTLNGIDRL